MFVDCSEETLLRVDGIVECTTDLIVEGIFGVGIANPSLSIFVSTGVSGRGDMLNVLTRESCFVFAVLRVEDVDF